MIMSESQHVLLLEDLTQMASQVGECTLACGNIELQFFKGLPTDNILLKICYRAQSMIF
jgi:hypothetical protein